MLGLGSVAVRQGHLKEATDHFTRARDLSERAGWPHNRVTALIGLAGVVSEQGDHTGAARLLGRARALLVATGASSSSPTRRFASTSALLPSPISAKSASLRCSTPVPGKRLCAEQAQPRL